ncbi:hypothetical protein [uncultured Ruegeria sp.]|uniref:hypothetical protein n=1 Tax=uncultured Ruegeria sp. TaxID=259304 RepID=UPI00261F446F|nr:hypothetical protein [uncultured Ruegeria sp.]
MRRELLEVVVAIGCLASLSTGAVACESAPQNHGFKLKKVLPDCSFEHSGRGKWNYFGGNAVVDIGNGRIGQRIKSGQGCSPRDALFFQDCTTGESIVIEGKYFNSGIAGHVPTSIDLIQKPDGPIGLTSATTVPELEQIPVEHRYSFTKDVQEFFGRTEDHKRIDYTCGCKLYYPDSPGAKL